MLVTNRLTEHSTGMMFTRRALGPILVSALMLGSSMNSTRADILQTLRRANEGLRRFELENGLVCLVKADASAPVVAVQIWVGAGSIHEEPLLGAGLAHYLEHMIFKGTATRGVGEITKAIDDAGGEINAYTSQDRTVYYCELPARHWKVGVDVLADAMMNASLPADECEREREVILREFAMGRDSPERELSKLMWGTAFRVHPFRFPVIGHEDVFRSITRDDLVAYYRRHYVPDNMILAVVGDIDPDEVERYVRSVFGTFQRRGRRAEVLPPEPPQLAPREARRTMPVELARLAMAWQTVSLDHPDAPALDVLAAIVGQGRSSRLERQLKEKERLVHEIGAWSFTPREPGLFAIQAVFEPDNEEAVIQAIERQIESWRAGEFDAAEIEKARRNLLVNELDDLQTMQGQASSLASGEFYAGNPHFSETFLSAVQQVDASRLREVVNRYLTPHRRNLAVLSPRASAGRTGEIERRAELAVHRLGLSNGIPLIVREDRRLPFLYAAVVFGGGLLTENETNNGITDLMANLLTRGTASLSAEAFAERVEQLGASIEPFSGRNSFGLTAMMLSDDAEKILSLMAECLLAPAFDPAEFEKQRALQIAGIRRRLEQPMQVAQDQLRELLFPDHPYRFHPSGRIEAVERLKPDDVRAYFAKLVNRSNVAIALFGDISCERAAELAERYFSALPPGDRPPLTRPATPPTLPTRAERTEPRQQAIVLMGFPGVSMFDPRVDALHVLQKALSGLSSDLGIEIREKRGLVYFVGASSLVAADPGFFALYAGTRNDAVGEVERLMLEQVERLGREGLRIEEFERARAQLAAAAAMSLQNNGELALASALNEFYGLGYRYAFEAEQRLMALKPEDIRDAARQILEPGRRAVSIVLPDTQGVQAEEVADHDDDDESGS